jgi:hypothetical protein
MKVQRMYNHLGNRCETISRRKSHRAAATAKEIALSIPPRSYVKEYLPPYRSPPSPLHAGARKSRRFHLSTRILVIRERITLDRSTDRRSSLPVKSIYYVIRD